MYRLGLFAARKTGRFLSTASNNQTIAGIIGGATGALVAKVTTPQTMAPASNDNKEDENQTPKVPPA